MPIHQRRVHPAIEGHEQAINGSHRTIVTPGGFAKGIYIAPASGIIQAGVEQRLSLKEETIVRLRREDKRLIKAVINAIEAQAIAPVLVLEREAAQVLANAVFVFNFSRSTVKSGINKRTEVGHFFVQRI